MLLVLVGNDQRDDAMRRRMRPGAGRSSIEVRGTLVSPQTTTEDRRWVRRVAGRFAGAGLCPLVDMSRGSDRRVRVEISMRSTHWPLPRLVTYAGRAVRSETGNG